MKLEEVLPALREGKKIRRSYWHDNEFLTKRGSDVVKTCFDDELNYWYSDYAEILGYALITDDWEVVE